MDNEKLLNNIKKFIKMKQPNEKTLNYIEKVINDCSNMYYDEDIESPLTDEEFDYMFNHYSKFRKTKKAIDTSSSKSNKNLIDTEHIFPELVGTLDKTNFITNKDREIAKNDNTTTVEEWIKPLTDNIDKNKKLDFYISWKLDGNSITIVWNDKREVVMALTRGKDGLGADKTEFFKNRKLPKEIVVPKDDLIGIKFEAITTYSSKDKMCEIMNKEYANPRSLVAGTLGRKDNTEEVINMIELAPIRVNFKNNHITRKEELEYLLILSKDKSFPINIKPSKNAIDIKIQSGTLKELPKIIKEFYDKANNDEREKLSFPVDGLVVEIINEDVRKSLGRKSDRNNFEFALKFPYSTKRTKVKDIEFYLSEEGTGIITPVVVFDELNFSGAKCNHVSIANYLRFKELNLAKDDIVNIEYRNDVLSYLTPTNIRSGNKSIKFISVCPSCGEKLKVTKNKTFVFCSNKNCPSIKIGKINHFLISIGIDSIRYNTVRDLYEGGLIKSISDLFKLTKKDILQLEGYKDKSAENIVSTINQKKDYFDWELIGSLGFKSIGPTICKLIFTQFTLNELLSMKDDQDKFTNELRNIKGIGEIVSKDFYKGIISNLKLIRRLEKVLNIKNYKDTITVSNDPKNIVFTGFRNKEIQDKLEQHGHKITGNVSGKTDILVCKEKGSGSTKEKKAESLGIPIYSIDEFVSNIIDTIL